MSLAWRILITDGLAPEGVALLGAECEVVESDDLEALAAFDAVVVRSRTQVRAGDIERARPRLRVIGRAGVGVDNIDLAAAQAAGVVVVHAPNGASTAVAEHALALMLALARRIPEADASMKQGDWQKREWEGSELAGKTLGLVGFGRIGRALGDRAVALGMRVVAHDPLVPDEAIRGGGAEPLSLGSLLARADFLSVHVPLSDSTLGMIGREQIRMMKPGARLINTARGGLVDEDALLEALESGHLAGAALDVFALEPPGPSPLVSHPNVIATPHVGSQTAEAQRRAAAEIAGEVLAALRGMPLRWRVA
jgi:D-3-phosphoglycerate dehydrogenase